MSYVTVGAFLTDATITAQVPNQPPGIFSVGGVMSDGVIGADLRTAQGILPPVVRGFGRSGTTGTGMGAYFVFNIAIPDGEPGDVVYIVLSSSASLWIPGHMDALPANWEVLRWEWGPTYATSGEPDSFSQGHMLIRGFPEVGESVLAVRHLRGWQKRWRWSVIRFPKHTAVKMTDRVFFGGKTASYTSVMFEKDTAAVVLGDAFLSSGGHYQWYSNLPEGSVQYSSPYFSFPFLHSHLNFSAGVPIAMGGLTETFGVSSPEYPPGHEMTTYAFYNISSKAISSISPFLSSTEAGVHPRLIQKVTDKISNSELAVDGDGYLYRYAGLAGRIAKYSPDNQTQEWITELSSGSAYVQWLVAEADGSAVYCVLRNDPGGNYVVKINGATGAEIWRVHRGGTLSTTAWGGNNIIPVLTSTHVVLRSTGFEGFYQVAKSNGAVSSPNLPISNLIPGGSYGTLSALKIVSGNYFTASSVIVARIGSNNVILWKHLDAVESNGIEVDSAMNVYAVMRTEHEIRKYDTDGNVTWAITTLTHTSGTGYRIRLSTNQHYLMVFAPNGEIYAVCTRTGELVATLRGADGSDSTWPVVKQPGHDIYHTHRHGVYVRFEFRSFIKTGLQGFIDGCGPLESDTELLIGSTLYAWITRAGAWQAECNLTGEARKRYWWAEDNYPYTAERFYRCYLTGDPDIEVPISSLQFRLNNDRVSFLSVVVPNVPDYVEQVVERGEGVMILRHGLRSGDTELSVELARGDIDTIRFDEGSRSSSLTITARGVVDFPISPEEDKIVTDIVSRSLYANGLSMIRTQPIFGMFPGDVMRIGDGDHRKVERISTAVNRNMAQSDVYYYDVQVNTLYELVENLNQGITEI